MNVKNKFSEFKEYTKKKKSFDNVRSERKFPINRLDQ